MIRYKLNFWNGNTYFGPIIAYLGTVCFYHTQSVLHILYAYLFNIGLTLAMTDDLNTSIRVYILTHQ